MKQISTTGGQLNVMLITSTWYSTMDILCLCWKKNEVDLTWSDKERHSTKERQEQGQGSVEWVLPDTHKL